MELLVATVPLVGHVQPMLEVVRALVARGHAVRWVADAAHADAIAATGATFVPTTVAVPIVRGGGVKQQLRRMFIAPAPAQAVELAAQPRADAILADSAHLGAALHAERTGARWIGLGISALMVPSIDTPPPGAGWPPSRLPVVVLRRALNWLVFSVAFGGVTRAYRRARAELGLPPTRRTYFELIAPDLYLQPTIPALEYPRRDLPPQVRFIGPLIARARDRVELPPWWDELAAPGDPIVLVTQGTLADDARDLVVPTLRALAGEPVRVIATTPAALDDVPRNARVARFVPYAQLLPRVAAMVTNGGYGGVQMALAHGVPLVVAGGSEEKPEIAARVAWAGAGIDLRGRRPGVARIRRAVRRVLGEPRFVAGAAALAAEMARCDAPHTAVDLIERALR